MFKHHQDGYIVFEGGAILPLSEFLLEEPDYPGLPNGMTGREYIPGKRHFLFNDDTGHAEPQPLNWALGDQYIANRETYFVNQQARRSADAARLAAEAAVQPQPERPLTESDFQKLNLEEKVDYLFQRLSR